VAVRLTFPGFTRPGIIEIVPKKTYGKNKSTCRVTFELPAGVEAQSASLVGDFNGWSQDSHPMTKRKDGRFSVTVSLNTEQSYRYRFLLDGSRWENDWAADTYVTNSYGTEDSLVQI
jgi:1,4-alpha-glucan branching enzyme